MFELIIQQFSSCTATQGRKLEREQWSSHNHIDCSLKNNWARRHLIYSHIASNPIDLIQLHAHHTQPQFLQTNPTHPTAHLHVPNPSSHAGQPPALTCLRPSVRVSSEGLPVVRQLGVGRHNADFWWLYERGRGYSLWGGEGTACDGVRAQPVKGWGGEGTACEGVRAQPMRVWGHSLSV